MTAWISSFGSEPFAMGPVQFSDPAEWPNIGLLNQNFGSIFSVFPRKKSSKTRNSLNFLQSGPGGNLLNLIFRDWPRSGGF